MPQSTWHKTLKKRVNTLQRLMGVTHGQETCTTRKLHRCTRPKLCS